MNAATLIARAAAEGVILDLTPAGTLKATGATTTVDRWLPVIRQHKEAILAALAHCGGNRTAAAHALGISVRTLQYKLKEYQALGIRVD